MLAPKTGELVLRGAQRHLRPSSGITSKSSGQLQQAALGWRWEIPRGRGLSTEI
jgi:hypothetical protein